MEIRFSDADWERIERDYVAWWNHELERPLVQIMGREPDPDVEYPVVPEFLSNVPPSVSAERIIDDITRQLEATRFYGDAFPRLWLNFGPGIIAGFLGAIVHSVERTVWFEPPDNRPASEIHLAYSTDSYWWQRIRDITQAAVDAWGQQVQISHTDLGGNLDIIASFRSTQHLLLDLYDCPEEIERLVGETTRLWIAYYEALDRIIRPQSRGTTPWAPIWSPDKCYMLQCDFSYMISPDMFERFVLPDLIACCDYLDHGFYHLDGPGQIPHVDLLLEMERLRGIQWIPGDGAPKSEAWPELLKRIIDGGKLCQLFVTAQGALDIVRTVGGKGFLLAISDEMTADEASDYLALLEREDISRG